MLCLKCLWLSLAFDRVLWFSVVICMAGKCLKTQRRQSSAASFNLQQGNKSVTLDPWQTPPSCPCSNLEPRQIHRKGQHCLYEDGWGGGI